MRRTSVALLALVAGAILLTGGLGRAHARRLGQAADPPAPREFDFFYLVR